MEDETLRRLFRPQNCLLPSIRLTLCAGFVYGVRPCNHAWQIFFYLPLYLGQ